MRKVREGSGVRAGTRYGGAGDSVLSGNWVSTYPPRKEVWGGVEGSVEERMVH